MTAAKNNFESHIQQCSEAIEIYEYLEKIGYSADFGLRYVWVASISALDHYVSELIVEKSTEQFANGIPLTAKLLNEGVPLDAVLKINAASPAQTIVEFRNSVSNMVRYRTFQKADDVADGLAFVWGQKQKWKKISATMGATPDQTKATLNAIAYRRDLIVHNADYNEASGALFDCDLADAKNAVSHIVAVVQTIDSLVP
ncbi:hypothetical protein [Ruegeria sp. B32]|uniref:hypothetical protein n=1 Tax=Ruegeria sp. B32 TaxID=2867020 RepID=UPI0021A8E6A1|nr:hypothetical protein [Ruegeria sp. B32]UWR07658.1 hypothetical protein K3752_01465 [Ruegeria sp. B32]